MPVPQIFNRIYIPLRRDFDGRDGCKISVPYPFTVVLSWEWTGSWDRRNPKFHDGWGSRGVTDKLPINTGMKLQPHPTSVKLSSSPSHPQTCFPHPHPIPVTIITIRTRCLQPHPDHFYIKESIKHSLSPF